MATLAERSLSAPYVFHPEDYTTRSSGQREPCDLAWVGPGCTVLMALADRPKKSADWIYKHNVESLLGWLKAWRRGERLKGANGFATFDIGCDEHRYAVLISSATGPNATCQYHAEPLSAENTRTARVVACASLTQNVLEELAGGGAGIRDLLALVEYLRVTGETFTAEEAQAFLRTTLTAAYGRAREMLRADGVPHASFEWAQTALLGSRAPGSGAKNADLELRGSVFDVLADLSVEELAELAALLGREHEAIRRESGTNGTYEPRTLRHQIGPYLFIAPFFAMETMGELFRATDERDKYDAAHPDYPATMLAFMGFAMDLHQPMLTRKAGDGPSLTEQMIDAWPEAQALRTSSRRSRSSSAERQE
jgi:hypothetical protein